MDTNGALLLVPDFAMILLGLLLRSRFGFEDRFWAGLERLVYYVLFPALLFHALTRAPIDVGAAAPLVATGVIAISAGIVLGLLARPLFGQPALVFASQFQCAFRFNSYIGLAAIGKLYGQPGIATMGIVMGAVIPYANLASVWMLARHGNLGVVRELVRNPLVLSTVAGLAFNLAGLTLPALPQQVLGRLSEASIPLGLLAVGAALELRGASGGHAVAAVWFLAVKLLAVPAVAWITATALGLHGVYFAAALLVAALPIAPSAYILAVRMGGDGPTTARLISASTLLAMVTLPLWIAAAG